MQFFLSCGVLVPFSILRSISLYLVTKFLFSWLSGARNVFHFTVLYARTQFAEWITIALTLTNVIVMWWGSTCTLRVANDFFFIVKLPTLIAVKWSTTIYWLHVMKRMSSVLPQWRSGVGRFIDVASLQQTEGSKLIMWGKYSKAFALWSRHSFHKSSRMLKACQTTYSSPPYMDQPRGSFCAWCIFS